MRAFWERDLAWQQALAASAGALVIAVGVAWASDQLSGNGMSVPSTATSQLASRTTAFEQMTPGNRLIAEALFAAQMPDDGMRSSWPLTRIAMERAAGQSWGDVFQEMKGENLLRADTLGQVVTWYQYNYLKPEPYAGRASIATTPASDEYGN